MEAAGLRIRQAPPRPRPSSRAQPSINSLALPLAPRRAARPPTPRMNRRPAVPRYEYASDEYESDSSVVSGSTASATSPPGFLRAETMPRSPSNRTRVESRSRERTEHTRTSSTSPPPPAPSSSSKLARLSRADKGLLGFQQSETSVRSTISRDNTAGEHARHASLFAEYGRKMAPKSQNDSIKYPFRRSPASNAPSSPDKDPDFAWVRRPSPLTSEHSDIAPTRTYTHSRAYTHEDIAYSSFDPSTPVSEGAAMHDHFRAAREYIMRSRGANPSRDHMGADRPGTKIEATDTSKSFLPPAKPRHKLRRMES